MQRTISIVMEDTVTHAEADRIWGLVPLAVEVEKRGPGWTEAPYTSCDDCRAVWPQDVIAYVPGAGVYVCPMCSGAA